jgi:hypothetical protein
VTVTALDAAAKARLAERMIPSAMELACMVRDEDAKSIGSWIRSLSAAEKDALLVVLAAMVPVDRTPQELLEHVTWDEHGRALPAGAEMVLWTPQRRVRQNLRPCGTPAAIARHYAHGEPLCEACGAVRKERRAAEYARKKQREESEAVA